MRRYRQRQRLGRILLKIDVEERLVASYLIGTGRLSEAQALDRRAVERAMATAVAELAENWRLQKM
jgi:hypothetical protein